MWQCDSSSLLISGDLIDLLPLRSPVEIYMTVPVGAAGVRGLGGRGYLAYATGGGAMGRGGGSASYGLKGDKQADEKLYDLLPGMELTPMNPAAMSLKASGIKPPTQVMEHTPIIWHCLTFSDIFLGLWEGRETFLMADGD